MYLFLPFVLCKIGATANVIAGKSKHPTAGSFVRPSRPADKPRGFLEATREKYASEFLEQELARQQRSSYGDSPMSTRDPLHDSIEISGKVVEEVGFDKIRKKLAALQELKIVLLDGLRVAGILAGAHAGMPGSGGESSSLEEERDKACREIEETCPKIAELDLSRCLLSRWRDVADICRRLERLRVLKLKYVCLSVFFYYTDANLLNSGNRFGPVEDGLRFEGITELHLNETLLSWDEVC